MCVCARVCAQVLERVTCVSRCTSWYVRLQKSYSHTHPHTNTQTYVVFGVVALIFVAAVHVDVHDVGPVLERRRAEEREHRDGQRAEVERVVLLEGDDAGDRVEVEDEEEQP